MSILLLILGQPLFVGKLALLFGLVGPKILQLRSVVKCVIFSAIHV